MLVVVDRDGGRAESLRWTRRGAGKLPTPGDHGESRAGVSKSPSAAEAELIELPFYHLSFAFDTLSRTTVTTTTATFPMSAYSSSCL